MRFSQLLLTSAISLFGFGESSDETSFTVDAGIQYSNQVGSQILLNQLPFANSWSTPSNIAYAPQTTNFNRVVLEMQVNSTGTNYDRLGQLFIDDMEIWRTSTAEPDDQGTTWTVRKDVSAYGDLFKSDRTINLLIKNRVTSQFTGVFYVTLTAYFYNDSSDQGNFDGNWMIDLNNLPTSVQPLTKSGSQPGSSWSAPGDAISASVGPLDRSVNRAVLHVFASGNGDDEFWWDTAHQSSSAGPARFVDAYVGNNFAGFVSPYPIIFTGGVNPYLWKPMVDINTFDVPAYFIDITPFLPALWEESTDISLNVTNGLNNEKIPSNWLINYNLLTWSENGQSNSGQMNSPQYTNNHPGSDAQTSVLVTRNLTTSAELNIGGKQQTVSWEQDVAFNNTLESQGSDSSYVWQTIDGTASVSGPSDFTNEFSYPFQCQMSSRYLRVQQSFEVTENNQPYSQWIDTSVSLDDQGAFSGSSSRQYVSSPGGSHYGETQNLQLVEQW